MGEDEKRLDQSDPIDVIVDIFKNCGNIRSSHEWSLFVDLVTQLERRNSVPSPERLTHGLDDVVKTFPQFYRPVYEAMLGLLDRRCMPCVERL